MKIEIGHKIFSVIEVEEIQENTCDGLMDYENNVIYIDSKMDKDRKILTLLHEVVHGVLFYMGESNSEKFVTNFTNNLYTVFKKNKDFSRLFATRKK